MNRARFTGPGASPRQTPPPLIRFALPRGRRRQLALQSLGPMQPRFPGVAYRGAIREALPQSWARSSAVSALAFFSSSLSVSDMPMSSKKSQPFYAPFGTPVLCARSLQMSRAPPGRDRKRPSGASAPFACWAANSLFDPGGEFCERRLVREASSSRADARRHPIGERDFFGHVTSQTRVDLAHLRELIR